MKNNKILILILIIAVVGLGGYFVYNEFIKEESTPSKEKSKNKEEKEKQEDKDEIKTDQWGERRTITYTSKNDYKVKLKENDFYDSNTISSGQSYISNLVDRIEINYDNDFDLVEEKLVMNKYKVIATLTIYDKNNNKIFEKTEELLREKQVKMPGMRTININEDIAVDYQHYNDMAKQTVQTIGIEGTAELNVSLIIDTTADSNNSVSITGDVTVNIPLLEDNFKITINKPNIKIEELK